jgi:hypothetical protein
MQFSRVHIYVSIYIYIYIYKVGHAVAQLVEALRHKRGGGVRLPMVSLEFSIGTILPVAKRPGVDSASNRNEYQEYFLRGKGGRCLGPIV